MSDHPPVRTHRVLEVPPAFYPAPVMVIRETDGQQNWEIVAFGETKRDALRAAAGENQ